MAYSPHHVPSTHKYDANPSSSNADYSHLDAPKSDEMYEAMEKAKYEATQDYHKISDDKLLNKDYQSKEAEEQKKKTEKEKDSIEKNIEKEEQKDKYKSKNKISEEEITKKAAEEIRQEINKDRKEFINKKNKRTIEEAIKKAISEEKEIVHK